MLRKKVVVFEKPGPQNTETCIGVVREAVSQGIANVVVASTTGNTGLSLASALKGLGAKVIVITHSCGFKEPNSQELTPEKAQAIRDTGAQIHTGTILTHSLEVALTQKFGGIYPGMLIAQILRLFGQGTKVACEIAMEACDAGLLPEGEEALSVGGTAEGADTVLIVRSAASKRIFDLKVLEILAKPRE